MPFDPQQVQQLFLEAIKLSGQQRIDFLVQQCGANEELKHRIEALLIEHDDPNSIQAEAGPPLGDTRDSAPVYKEPDGIFLDTQDSSPAQDRAIDSDSNSQGETRSFTTGGFDRGVKISERYTLLEKIGEGGMGEVWVASQSQPVKRKVAIKLIKTGMDSKSVLARFEQERQALAIMDHPNIARVLDGGITNTGQPFFVMELVNGRSVTRFCDDAKLSPKERLQLFVPICRAVQHAHQKGIVHRDLKPANILITMIDGQPVPKVIDFGVAKATHGKLTEQTLTTQLGAVVGTLEYMSPEQAGLSVEDVDTRADIYSLGVILYELLTGLRPFDSKRLKKAALIEMVRIIQEEEPSKPSTRLSTAESLPSLAAVRNTDPRKLKALLRGELDWVVLKCLEKNRERRYETANGLARDIERHLSNDPVEARPPTAGYRLQKFLRRNKGLVATLSIVSVLLVAGVIGTSLGMIEARRQKQVAIEESDAANKARIAEQEQREVAEKANRQALAALDSFTSDLMGRLLGGKSKITENEKAILQNALGQWEVFAQSKGSSAEAQETRAIGSANVSRIQFELGMTELAIASDRRTLQIWLGLLKQNPTNEGYRLRCANGFQDLGSTLRSVGRRQEAAEHFAKAIEGYRRLVSDFPDYLEYQSSLADSLTSMGNVERDFGNVQASETHYLASLNLHEKLAVAEPGSDTHRENVARSNWGLAFLYKRQRKFEQSKGHYQNTIKTYRELAEENEDNLSYVQVTGGLYREYGGMLSDSGNYKAGAAELKNALPIERKLYEDFPSIPRYAFEYSKSLRDLAKALREDQRFEESEPFIDEAVAIQEKLIEGHPTVIQYQSSLGFTLRVHGRLKEKQNNPAEARKAYDRSISVLTSAFAQDRKYANVKNALFQSHEYRASLLDGLGKHREATLDWEKALEFCPEEERNFVRYGQADSLLRSGETEKAIEEIEVLAKIDNPNPEHWFRFAKLYSIASLKVEGQKGDFAAKSVQLLLRAIELGFDDIDRIQKDKDLKNLSTRDDFKEIVKSQKRQD